MWQAWFRFVFCSTPGWLDDRYPRRKSCRSPERRRRAVVRSIGSVLQARRGVAALEFGILASLLIVLLLGGFDVANALQQSIRLRQAVEAGSVYAVQYPGNSSGITSAIQAALPQGWNGTAAISCSCVSSSGTASAAPSCPATCASGSLQSLMTLSVTMPFSPWLLASLTQVSATNVIQYK